MCNNRLFACFFMTLLMGTTRGGTFWQNGCTMAFTVILYGQGAYGPITPYEGRNSTAPCMCLIIGCLCAFFTILLMEATKGGTSWENGYILVFKIMPYTQGTYGPISCNIGTKSNAPHIYARIADLHSKNWTSQKWSYKDANMAARIWFAVKCYSLLFSMRYGSYTLWYWHIWPSHGKLYKN